MHWSLLNTAMNLHVHQMLLFCCINCILNKIYGWSSHKWPPKMSSQGGRWLLARGQATRGPHFESFAYVDQTLSQVLIKTHSNNFLQLIQREKILGSMMILYLTNELGLFLTWSGPVWILSSNGTLAKILAIRLFQETLPIVPLFQHLSDNFQFQFMRTKAQSLTSD